MQQVVGDSEQKKLKANQLLSNVGAGTISELNVDKVSALVRIEVA